ncbi:cellulase family glycosylhydrolase [Pendulispora albinea]|uniref:Glycoside hydrolase family 5 protein n=1 Tax=Pendulispora albinea TaxID=2741071 RepID=A0ABZ2LME7_9BACT
MLGAAGALAALSCQDQGDAPLASTAQPLVAARSPIAVARKGQASEAWVFRDAAGREIVLRGFNVAGSTKLYENGLLPFRSTADAAKSAQAMRDQTGANAVRFLISWEGVQPAAGSIGYAYLDRAIAQMREFVQRGFYILVDYHQDLYSAHLFDTGSWYTGDGAPKWIIQAGNYPAEWCGACLLWGQNMQSNGAVRQAAHDLWHNRRITTSAGEMGVQDAFLQQASAAMVYLEQQLSAQEFQSILGFNPFNEPFDGGLDGKSGLEWEKTYLWPFYQRFRSAMDAAGWGDKPAFVEPLVFWNTAVGEEGGLSSVGPLGARYVFNSHYYDGMRMVIDPTPASDGVYDAPMNRIRARARAVATAPFVSEFGNKMSGSGSDRTPWIVRAMYQAMDSGVAGAKWWDDAASGGTVLSSTQWHWDIYNGRHHELMNGNPDKVQTAGDAWNGEDFSVAVSDASGNVSLRLDSRVLDRLYPTAVAGDILAFAYEDLARSGFGGAGQQQAWLAAPKGMPNVAALIASRPFGVLIWREPAANTATTELHLPQSFAPASTVVVGDVARAIGLPSSGAVFVAEEPGSAIARRLVIRPSGGASGAIHVALVLNAASGPIVAPEQLTGAANELIAWRKLRFPDSTAP